MTDGRFAFATAVRVVARVHNRTAYFGTASQVTLLTGLTEGYDFVLGVADLTDHSTAGQRN